ncbi:hypothetical protein VN23_19745 [Janthinobacterium sp. B9-8]|nr:hypothetical protein VN23_19745 [Janthinobacterium sp. B9-8]
MLYAFQIRITINLIPIVIALKRSYLLLKNANRVFLDSNQKKPRHQMAQGLRSYLQGSLSCEPSF